eukprot:PhF_6_TR5198/c0_g1_i3/m.7483
MIVNASHTPPRRATGVVSSSVSTPNVMETSSSSPYRRASPLREPTRHHHEGSDAITTRGRPQYTTTPPRKIVESTSVSSVQEITDIPLMKTPLTTTLITHSENGHNTIEHEYLTAIHDAKIAVSNKATKAMSLPTASMDCELQCVLDTNDECENTLTLLRTELNALLDDVERLTEPPKVTPPKIVQSVSTLTQTLEEELQQQVKALQSYLASSSTQRAVVVTSATQTVGLQGFIGPHRVDTMSKYSQTYIPEQIVFITQRYCQTQGPPQIPYWAPPTSSSALCQTMPHRIPMLTRGTQMDGSDDSTTTTTTASYTYLECYGV